MTYARMGQRSLDFSLCQYGMSRNLFRGPKKQLNKPFIACIGSTDTFGQTVPAPFPILLERQLKRPVANFGIVNAGVDAFLKDPCLLELCKNSQQTVIQIMGAQSLSNDYYAVHPRRNDRFIRAHDKLRELYPTVDFTEFHFTRHLLSHLEATDKDRFDILRKHLRRTWRRKMKLLCDALPHKPYFLWLSSREISEKENGLLEADPNFITRRDIASLTKQSAGIIQTIHKHNLKQLPRFVVLQELDQSTHDICADQLFQALK